MKINTNFKATTSNTKNSSAKKTVYISSVSPEQQKQMMDKVEIDFLDSQDVENKPQKMQV